jgi:hypothetical protein
LEARAIPIDPIRLPKRPVPRDLALKPNGCTYYYATWIYDELNKTPDTSK